MHRPETWAAARTPQARAFLVETITNPLMRAGLLREIAGFARREGLLTVIDNTFATPVNFRPLQAGLDLCVHSAAKYLGGHSDLVAGAIMGSAELIGRVRRTLSHYGGSLDPHRVPARPRHHRGDTGPDRRLRPGPGQDPALTQPSPPAPVPAHREAINASSWPQASTP